LGMYDGQVCCGAVVEVQYMVVECMIEGHMIEEHMHRCGKCDIGHLHTCTLKKKIRQEHTLHC
jgi:hypothetical protein